jgi:hypothetical protein
VRLRLTVCSELRKVLSYRKALRDPDKLTAEDRTHMEAWVKVADELLEVLLDEPDGKRKAYFVNNLFGLRHKPPGSAKFVTSKCMHTMHVSEGGLNRWRDSAIYSASILALQHGAIDLSRDA